MTITHEVEQRSESASCSLDPVKMIRARLVTSLIIIGCLLPGLTRGDDVVRRNEVTYFSTNKKQHSNVTSEIKELKSELDYPPSKFNSCSPCFSSRAAWAAGRRSTARCSAPPPAARDTRKR